MTVPITWVDAFSDLPFGGNPAAVCLPHEPLDDGRMQSIAFELGISETAYVTALDDPTTFGLRWFSPAVEIDLCGHATLAAAEESTTKVKKPVCPLATTAPGHCPCKEAGTGPGITGSAGKSSSMVSPSKAAHSGPLRV
jgi:PhzF family phenazine biosynthesis protein